MILSVATMINIGLILGGTWYGKVKVESIDQNYAEAQKKINEATQAYIAAQTTSRSQMLAASAAIAQADAVSARASKLDETLAASYQSAQAAQSKLDDSVRVSLASFEKAFGEATSKLGQNEFTHEMELTNIYSNAASAVAGKQREQTVAFENDRKQLLSDLTIAKKSTEDELKKIDDEVLQLKLAAASQLLDAKTLKQQTAEDLEKVRSGHQVDLTLIWRNTNWDVFAAALFALVVVSGVSAAVTSKVLKR